MALNVPHGAHFPPVIVTQVTQTFAISISVSYFGVLTRIYHDISIMNVCGYSVNIKPIKMAVFASKIWRN